MTRQQQFADHALARLKHHGYEPDPFALSDGWPVIIPVGNRHIVATQRELANTDLEKLAQHRVDGALHK